MDKFDDVIGWSKKVLSERNDGAHEWLDAMYFCLTCVEAITLHSFRMPSHLKRGDQTLVRREPSIYGSESGEMFVVFDWRVSDQFIPLYTFSEI